MASFLAGDRPLASFDYDYPEAAADAATINLFVAGQTISAEASGDALTGTWEALTLPEVGMYPIYAIAGADGGESALDGGDASSTYPTGGGATVTVDGGDASSTFALPDRSQRFLVDWLIVCDPDDEWFNVETARLEWEGAPDADNILHRLLDVSRDQVEAYAPDLELGAPVPERYRAGQLMQARNTFNASLTNGDSSYEAGGFTISPRPLDWAVKQVLRPKTATKVIG